uniref:non-specific serine/threonine protein kinase n=1 Tax=Gongylonema pulchrum TaxID=637853 RepID=A0A183DY09_9BILA
LQRGVFESIEGCLSTGKEANIYHAKTESGKSIAVKVYKTSILIFRDRDRYVTGEYRCFYLLFLMFTFKTTLSFRSCVSPMESAAYRHGYCKGNPRKMVTVWAEKEMRNLSRMHSAGLPVPEPKIVKQNVLSVEHAHPHSLEFLRSDCSNITRFFRSKGVCFIF